MTKEVVAEVVAVISRQICFDAQKSHKEMEALRKTFPEVVGYCEHHGGKCSDLLTLIYKLENETK